MVGFAFVVTMIIYIVLDYDYPRFGLIRIDFADRGEHELKGVPGTWRLFAVTE